MAPRRIEAQFALLTPTNRGAIAVYRVWGTDARAIVDTLFRPVRGPRLSETSPGRLRLGRIGEGLGDEVVAVNLRSESRPGWLSAPPSVEIQCHGGPAAWELVAGALLKAGAERRGPADWTQESMASPSCAAAWSDLVRAPTLRSAEVLLEQALGALDREVEALIDALRPHSKVAPTRTATSLDTLLSRANLGTRLVEGWRIALAGRPNVGKSSLLNALAGFARSIVDSTPGTTRDVVTVSLAVDGWPVEISDTAGLRASTGELESLGIERGRRAQQDADLVLPVLDRSQILMPADLELIREYAAEGAAIVLNKSDLPPAWEAAELGIEGSTLVAISAKDGMGINRLVSAIGRWIVSEPPEAGAGVPIRSWQVNLLREASRLLSEGSRGEAVARLSEFSTAREVD